MGKNPSPGIIGYVRVSTSMQADSGLSVTAQENVIREYASRNGLYVAAIYAETISGTRRNRPVLAKALHHARVGGYQLVVARLDRLTRNVGLLRDIIDSSVPFIACDYPSADRMLLTILSAVAEYEAEKISSRISAVTATRRARGDKLGAPENFSATGRKKGNDVIKKRAIARHAQSTAYAIELRRRGLSLRAIALLLSENGYGEYTPTGVSRILKRAGEA
jgi:DNA invertase Pin-like site-specific DNA recombinase